MTQIEIAQTSEKGHTWQGETKKKKITNQTKKGSLFFKKKKCIYKAGFQQTYTISFSILPRVYISDPTHWWDIYATYMFYIFSEQHMLTVYVRHLYVLLCTICKYFCVPLVSTLKYHHCTCRLSLFTFFSEFSRVCWIKKWSYSA